MGLSRTLLGTPFQYRLSVARPLFQSNEKLSSQNHKRVFVIRFLLVGHIKLRIKMPEKHTNNISQFHHCKTDVRAEVTSRYGFPMQLREPEEKAIKAAGLHVSFPLSLSIQRVGINSWGFEKFRSSCITVQFGMLTTVYG